MFCKLLLLAAITLALFSATTANIPSYLLVCKTSDPKVDECIQNSIQQLLPKLKNGIRELDVPPIEPMFLENISLQGGVHSNLTDLRVHGITHFELTTFKSDIANGNFWFKSVAPVLTFEGDYDLDMHIVFIPIKGKGKIRGTLHEFHVDGNMHGKKIQINGTEYLEFEKFNLKMHANEAKVHLDNLFGEQFFGDITNSVINRNINIIMDDIMPALESSMADHLTEIANKIMDSFPNEELFPK